MLGFYRAMQQQVAAAGAAGRPLPVVLPSYNGARKQAKRRCWRCCSRKWACRWWCTACWTTVPA